MYSLVEREEAEENVLVLDISHSGHGLCQFFMFFYDGPLQRGGGRRRKCQCVYSQSDHCLCRFPFFFYRPLCGEVSSLSWPHVQYMCVDVRVCLCAYVYAYVNTCVYSYK